jgi:predicted nucleotidyltransferase
MEKYKKTILKTINSFEEIELCIVFGSVPSGKASPESDLDIAVAGKHSLSEEKYLELIAALSGSTHREIDLIDLNAVNGPILKKALSTGVVILNRDKNLYARLISRMLFDEADMMPYFHRTLEERRKRFLNGQGSC